MVTVEQEAAIGHFDEEYGARRVLDEIVERAAGDDVDTWLRLRMLVERDWSLLPYEPARSECFPKRASRQPHDDGMRRGFPLRHDELAVDEFDWLVLWQHSDFRQREL